MFKICVAGGSGNYVRVRIGFVCIGHFVLITHWLCVVRFSKKGLFLPQTNIHHRYRGEYTNLASGSVTSYICVEVSVHTYHT